MKRKTLSTRLMAILLSFAMLASPLQAAAAPVESTTLAASEDPTLRSPEVEDPEYFNEELSTEIVAEMEELRESHVKYFRMSDGTYTAVTYNVPVHYEAADGSFQEIDNTLVPAGTSTGTAIYTNEAGLYQVEVPASLDQDTPIALTFKDYRIEWTFENAALSQPGLLKNPLTDAV